MPEIDCQKDRMFDAASWTKAAEGLIASASLLDSGASKYWDSKGTDKQEGESHLKTQLMLAGFALENIFKALIVQDQRDSLESEYSSNGKLPNVLKNHNLIDLAKQALLTLGDDGTKGLLGRLMRHSIWAGRYPVPIRSDDLPAEDFFNLKSPSLVCVAAYIKQDWENTLRLFSLAKQILERRQKAQHGDPPNTHSPSAQGVGGR